MRRLPAALRLARKALLSRAAFAAAGFLAATALFGMEHVERAAFWASWSASKAFVPEAELAAASRSKAGGAAAFDNAPSKDFAKAPSGPAAAPRQWVIPYRVDLARAPIGPARALAIVQEAAKAWEPCGARFAYQGPASLAEYGPYGPGERPELLPVVAWMALPDDDAGLAWVESADPAAGSPAGEPQTVKWTIQLDPESTDTPGSLLATATHELGHALGMSHSRDKASIMFGGENSALRPTARDLEECRRVLSAWTEKEAARYGMAELAADHSSKVSTAPTLRSKSTGGALQAGMSAQASK